MPNDSSMTLRITDAHGKCSVTLSGDGPWIIGRDPACEIIISDERASRRHARISRGDRGWIVEDLGSSNGTGLDGRSIRGEAPFPRGSSIQIGDAKIRRKSTGKIAADDRSGASRTTSTQKKETSKREATTETSQGRRTAVPRSAAPRSTRVRKQESTQAGSLFLLLLALGAIGYSVNTLFTPVDPSESNSTEIAAIKPERSVPAGNDTVEVPLPENDATKPVSPEESVEKTTTIARSEKDGFQPDARFEIRFDENDPEETQVIGDDTIPDVVVVTREERKGLSLTLIDDGWPPSERIIAYEYHQKDHHGGPTFIDRRGKELERRGAANRKNYRVIAVEVKNSTDRSSLVQIKTPLRNDLELRFTVEAGRTLRRFIAIENPGSDPIVIEMLDAEGEPLDRIERILGPGRITENGPEAVAIAREREREEWVRDQFQLRPIEIQVVDENGQPIEAANLMLLSSDTLGVLEGRTDADGRWKTMAIPGGWTVVAQGEIEDEVDPDAPTQVSRLQRYYLLQGTIADGENSLILAPQKNTVISVQDVNGKGLQVNQMWITPESVAQAFTTERVAREVAGRGRLESQRTLSSGRFRLLLSGDPVDICVQGQTASAEPFLMRNRTGGDRDLVLITVVPEKMGRLQYTAESAFGGASDGTVEVVSIDGFRERFTLDTKDARTAWVIPGTYRLDVRSKLPGRETSRFLPYRTELKTGQRHDLEPRAPWTQILHYERKGKNIQMRLSLSDGGGRVLEKSPGKKGSLAAVDQRGQVLIERKIGPMRWQEPETLRRVDLDKIQIQIDVPYGNSAIRGLATPETPVTINDSGSSATGPSVFSARMKAMMPEVARSLRGCKEHLGCADGVLRLLMDFDIFLPPGVGGLGGGGVIVLDAAVLHEYTGIGDILPGAYTHELGHNIGFGHDPYMLLADCGVDEGIYGELGYRLLNASAFQNTLNWLLNHESDRRTPWQPNPSVFAALRFFHGTGVHHKMFTERRSSEQTLRLHGLSSIERIAALYSLALGKNIAWIFRANGWPVFDDRVDLGGSSVKFAKSHPKQLNYNRLDGSIINGWWVRGPVEGNDKNKDLAPWRRIVWPTPFTDLSSGEIPISKNRRWLLFRRIAVREDLDARLAIATDIKMQVKINGADVGFIDASAQMSQPMHDELMLNNKKPFPIKLLAGENIIEVAATQLVGTRGFRIEVMTPDGTPVPLGVLDEGPQGENLTEIIDRPDSHQPLINGSFDAAGYLDGWIAGEVDPGGSIRFSEETEGLPIEGSALKGEVVDPGAGGIIQRIVVTPGKRYRVTALVKAENFQGEALLGFFTGRLGSWTSRSKPIRRDTDWTRISFEWSPGLSRTTYIACYLKGLSGTVWFDHIEFEEIR